MGEAQARREAGARGGARGIIHEHIIHVDDALERGERGIEEAWRLVNDKRATLGKVPLGYGDFVVYALVTRGLVAFWQAFDAEQREERLVLEPHELGKPPAAVTKGV